MGNWHIAIQGVGCHHNKDNPTDADRLFKTFVQKLKDVGHVVESATLTYGGKVEGIEKDTKEKN